MCRWNGFKHVLDQQYNQFYETVFGKCSVNPLSPHDALKHHFTSLKTDLIFLQLRSFRKKSMKLFCQYMAIFFNFSLISSHLYPIQVENCDSNSRLVVDEGLIQYFNIIIVDNYFHKYKYFSSLDENHCVLVIFFLNFLKDLKMPYFGEHLQQPRHGSTGGMDPFLELS